MSTATPGASLITVDDLEVGFLLEQFAQTSPHDLVVVEEKHASHACILPRRLRSQSIYAFPSGR